MRGNGHVLWLYALSPENTATLDSWPFTPILQITVLEKRQSQGSSCWMQETHLRKNSSSCTCENEGHVASSWDPDSDTGVPMHFLSGQHLPNSSAPFGVEGSDKYWSVLGEKVLIHLSILLTHWNISGNWYPFIRCQESPIIFRLQRMTLRRNDGKL